MSRKKPTGGRVTPKGTQATSTSAKRSATPARHAFPGRASVPAPGKVRTFGGPVAPTRSGHHRGNR